MKITSISKYKGSRCKIDVDGEYWYILDAEIINNYGLTSGVECSSELLDELRNAADYRRLKERALYLLGYRDHSRKELADKLSRTADNQEIINGILNKMEEYGFLDDERYAKKLARNLIGRKRFGKRRAEYDMRGKGVPPAIARKVLDEYKVDPQEQILELIERKFARYLEDEKGRKKTVNALLRMGHSYDNIKTAMERYEDEFEEHWN